MATLYAVLMTVIPLCLSPLLIVAASLNRWHVRERLQTAPGLSGEPNAPVAWFHAASVGEVVGLISLVNAFHENYPEHRIVVSTTTPTGLEQAEASLSFLSASFLLPFDAPILMKHLVRHLAPKALVLLEGELWPSLVKAASEFGCPIAIVNARMSDRSYPRNKWVRGLFQDMLGRIAVAGAQSQLDLERYVEFGLPVDRISVTGNVKFDEAASTKGPSREAARLSLAVGDDQALFIAGCPRPELEEQEVLTACQILIGERPDVRILWAPRHLDRLPDLERMLAAAGIAWIRRGHLESSDIPHPTLVLLDTVGELSSLYAAADVAFVGATLIPLGGHNLSEPASKGVPVLFGPNIQNVRASAEALIDTGGGKMVQNGSDLAAACLEILDDGELRARMGQSARNALKSGHGALAHSMRMLETLVLRPDPDEPSRHLRK